MWCLRLINDFAGGRMKNAYFGLLEEAENKRYFLTCFVSEIIEESV